MLSALKQWANRAGGVRDVWTKRTGAKRENWPTVTWTLHEELCLGPFTVDEREQGTYSLEFRDTALEQLGDDTKPYKVCGDERIKGTYSFMSFFVVQGDDFKSKDAEVVAVAKKMSDHMREQARAHGAPYIEGDIFNGQQAMFAECGLAPHPTRRLWVSCTA